MGGTKLDGKRRTKVHSMWTIFFSERHTVDGRNPFRPTCKLWETQSFLVSTGDSNPSRLSLVVRNGFGPQYLAQLVGREQHRSCPPTLGQEPALSSRCSFFEVQ